MYILYIITQVCQEYKKKYVLLNVTSLDQSHNKTTMNNEIKKNQINYENNEQIYSKIIITNK